MVRIGSCISHSYNIADEDQINFCNDFDEAMRKNVELLCYIRLKINIPAACDSDPKDVLFEFKGYPHFLPETETESVCFFAMAKPYPSKNTAMWVFGRAR